MEEKYGFVYLWFDKKHRRYYIGCRWGNENDGYICSSPWMKQGYKHRPKDFTRRILSKVYSNRKDLLEEEYKWLSLIKPEELGKKYYNLHNHHFNHWSLDENKKSVIGEKISSAPNRNINISKANKGRIVSNKTKEKLKDAAIKQFENEENRKILSEKSKTLWKNPEYREKTIRAQKGKKLSEDHKLKIKLSNIGKKRTYTNIECPHCNVIGRSSNMKRYHFNNCKKK